MLLAIWREAGRAGVAGGGAELAGGGKKKEAFFFRRISTDSSFRPVGSRIRMMYCRLHLLIIICQKSNLRRWCHPTRLPNNFDKIGQNLQYIHLLKKIELMQHIDSQSFEKNRRSGFFYIQERRQDNKLWSESSRCVWRH
jgi:hypothetical protein